MVVGVVVSAGAVEGVATDVGVSVGATVSGAADALVAGPELAAPWRDFSEEHPAAMTATITERAMVRAKDW